MAAPEEVEVWVGLDVGKDNHSVWVLDDIEQDLFSRPVANDETALAAVLEEAAEHGTPGLVRDRGL